jgi:hypothetical protein
MSDSRELLLDPLEPPPGGLAGLRRRIAGRERRRAAARSTLPALAIVAVAGCAAILAWLGSPPRPLAAPVLDDLGSIALGIAAPPVEPVTVPAARRNDTAVLRVPTRDDRVVLYLVAPSRPPDGP